MAKYKVIFNRENCIGTFACTNANPRFWKKGEDKKAVLEKAIKNKETGHYELMIDEEDREKNESAVSVCPVLVIRIEKVEE